MHLAPDAGTSVVRAILRDSRLPRGCRRTGVKFGAARPAAVYATGDRSGRVSTPCQVARDLNANADWASQGAEKYQSYCARYPTAMPLEA
jgi:hypothetical protein